MKQFYAKHVTIFMSLSDTEAEANTVPFSYTTRELGVESSSASKPRSIYALSHHPSNVFFLPSLPIRQQWNVCLCHNHSCKPCRILTFPPPISLKMSKYGTVLWFFYWMKSNNILHLLQQLIFRSGRKIPA